VRSHEDVANVVADRLNKVPGVTGTETHIAFRTYSRHDLESAFSIGLD
jgi:DNA-binding Lrp family transcriptional regulator